MIRLIALISGSLVLVLAGCRDEATIAPARLPELRSPDGSGCDDPKPITVCQWKARLTGVVHGKIVGFKLLTEPSVGTGFEWTFYGQGTPCPSQVFSAAMVLSVEPIAWLVGGSDFAAKTGVVDIYVGAGLMMDWSVTYLLDADGHTVIRPVDAEPILEVGTSVVLPFLRVPRLDTGEVVNTLYDQAMFTFDATGVAVPQKVSVCGMGRLPATLAGMTQEALQAELVLCPDSPSVTGLDFSEKDLGAVRSAYAAACYYAPPEPPPRSCEVTGDCQWGECVNSRCECTNDPTGECEASWAVVDAFNPR